MLRPCTNCRVMGVRIHTTVIHIPFMADIELGSLEKASYVERRIRIMTFWFARFEFKI